MERACCAISDGDIGADARVGRTGANPGAHARDCLRRIILAANPAAAEMLGYTTEELLSLSFRELFQGGIAGSAVSLAHADAGRLVELVHANGSTVRAIMSKSALLRGDDPVALATFEDHTEKLWAEEP